MTDTVKSKQKRKQKRSPALMAGIILLICTIILMITLALFTSFDEVTNVFDAGRVDIILTETKWDPEDAKNVVPEQVLTKNPRIKNNEKMVDTYVFLKVVVPYIDTGTATGKTQLEMNTGADKGTLITEEHAGVPLYKFVVTTNDNNTPDDPSDDTDVYDATYSSAQKVHNGWYLLNDVPVTDTVNKTYTYIYAHVETDPVTGENTPEHYMIPLMANIETRYPLFDKIRVANFNEQDFDYSRDYSIKVEAYGIQANFLKQNNTTTKVPGEVWDIVQQNY